MADIVIPSRSALLGGTELKAAGLIAADTAHTAISMGHSVFTVQMDWTACEIVSNDELYIVTVEANTEAATTTWTNIGYLAVLGALEVNAGEGDAPATGSLRGAFFNPYNHQVRLKTWVNGTIATGINFSAKAYPIESLSY
jgi:hypothetical protein